MNRRAWLIRTVIRSLYFRRGRSLLLVGVLAMATSLVTSLGIVSTCIGKRVAQEVRRYGANLVLMPDAPALELGLGGLNFGTLAAPAYLSQHAAQRALSRAGGLLVGHSLHLRGVLTAEKQVIPVEGVSFPQIRLLFPWWQLRGRWPGPGEAVVGVDLARRLSWQPGDLVELAGPEHPRQVSIAGIVTSGGEEDHLLFLELGELQGALGLADKLSSVRMLAGADGSQLAQAAAQIQAALPQAKVQEVRQLTTGSQSLLRKVQILMLLVTAVVLVTSGASVAGTMSSTVLERGKEIGLLKALGGTRRQVLFLFAAEAFSLGLLGGVAGYLAGNGIALAVTRTVFAAPIEFIPWLFPLALAVSLLLALLGCLGPMLSAYRLDPVRTLRGE